eukprot:956032_1
MFGRQSRWLERVSRLLFYRMFSSKTRPKRKIRTNSSTNGKQILPKKYIAQEMESRYLAVRHPDVAVEFHPTRNDNISVTEILSTSSKLVWWKCDSGEHEWQATPRSRTSYGAGCPLCSDYRLASEHSLATQYPQIVAEYHPSKNGGLSPADIYACSSKKVWWRCAIDPEHEWQARPADRTSRDKATGCPFCSGTQVSNKNSLAVRYPKIAAEFHPVKNYGISPAVLHVRSHKSLWWRCATDAEHEWQTTLDKRTRDEGTGCPYCSGHRVTSNNSLAIQKPKIAAEFHESKNNGLSPANVHVSSRKKVWWRCTLEAEHEWQTTPNYRTGVKGSACPFCSGTRVTNTNSLAIQQPKIAAEFHPSKNGYLSTNNIHIKSNKPVWWRCATDPEHEWKATPANRTGDKGTGCPFCSGNRVTSKNSMASQNPKIVEFHPTKNGHLSPDDLHVSSAKSVWWRCTSNSKHEWRTTLNNRTGDKGTGCPFCCGARVTNENSLAALKPEISGEFHRSKNGDLTPTDIHAFSGQKVWWRCSTDKRHEWKATPLNRIHAHRGCPFCYGARVVELESLATLYPGLAKEYHSSRNHAYPAYQISPRSTRSVWWQCRLNHEWKERVSSRVNTNAGCRECADILGTSSARYG